MGSSYDRRMDFPSLAAAFGVAWSPVSIAPPPLVAAPALFSPPAVAAPPAAVDGAAKAAKVPVYGLNAPITLVSAVGKGGLAALSAADRAKLPASIQESGDARYRAYVRAALAHGGSTTTPARLAAMTEAMAVWN